MTTNPNPNPTEFPPGSRNERDAILAEMREARRVLTKYGNQLEGAFPGIKAKLKSNLPENFRAGLQQAKPWLEKRAPKRKQGSKGRGKPRPTAKQPEPSEIQEPTPVAETPIEEQTQGRGIVVTSGGPPDVLDTFGRGHDEPLDLGGPRPLKGRRPGRHGTGKPGRKHDAGHRSHRR